MAPLNLAADFYTRPIMLAEGDDELTHWASDMRTLGVTQFGFMTDKPAIFTSAWLAHVPGLSRRRPARGSAWDLDAKVYVCRDIFQRLEDNSTGA